MISVLHLRAFGAELQKEGGIRSAIKDIAEGAVGAAKKRAKKVVAGASQAVSQKSEEIGSSVGKGMAGHGEDVGASIGRGLSEHAEPTGRAIGHGIAEHLSEGGSRMVEGGIGALKNFAKKRSVQAAGVGLGATYAGTKAYGIQQQRKRDKTQEDIARSLRRRKQETA